MSLVNTQMDIVGLGWGLKVCISNKISGDTDAAAYKPHSEKAGAW